MRNWQQVLAEILASPKERQRVAALIGVQERQLKRWMTEETQQPHPDNALALFRAIPPGPQKNELIELMRPLFPIEVARVAGEDAEMTIDTSLVFRMLRAYRDTGPALQVSTIQNQLLRRMRQRLDPYRHGLALLLACCKPVPGHADTLSLLIEPGATTGTGIWQERRIDPPLPWRIDAASVLCRAASGPQIVTLGESGLRASDLSRLHAREHIQSIGAFPILRSGQVAGSLLAISTQAEFFSLPMQDLIMDYLLLLQLAYRDRDFYDPSTIAYQQSTVETSERSIVEEAMHILEMLGGSSVAAQIGQWLIQTGEEL